jgi:repressor LexA
MATVNISGNIHRRFAMNRELTERQSSIYEFIVDRVRRRGIPPTLTEIADAFGLSSASGVADHLNALERKGFIRRQPGMSRGIELIGTRRRGSVAGERASAALRVPVLGSIPARERLSLSRPTDRHLVLDRRVTPGAAMAVRVELQNLEEHGILDGDYLILAPSKPARPGGLAVARLRKGTTLVEVLTPHGRVRRVDTRTEMQDGYEVLGDVVAVLRSIKEIEEENRP